MTEKKLYNYIINNYNDNFLLLKALKEIGINPSSKDVMIITSGRDDLFPAVEAVHILAYQLSVKENGGTGWNQNNYLVKLNFWFDKFNRSRDMWFQSKIAWFFDRACRILEKDLEWEPEEKIVPYPDTLEDLDPDQDGFLYKIMKKQLDSYTGEDLTERAQRLFKAIGFRADSSCSKGSAYKAMIKKLVSYFDRDLIPDDLQVFIAVKYITIGSMIIELRKGSVHADSLRRIGSSDESKPEPMPEPIPEPEPIPQPKKIAMIPGDPLWKGITRSVPGCSLRLLVEVIEEDGDFVTVRTVGPVNGKYEHKIQRDRIAPVPKLPDDKNPANLLRSI